MIELPRLKPEPIPVIHPVPEYLADEALRARYEDMKQVFQVPWMGVVTMAYAHYRAFYDTLWAGLRPLCTSRVFVEACTTLREHTERRVQALSPTPIVDRLGERGYAAVEIENIRDMNAVFSHGNFPYLLLATIVRRLLEGGELGAAGAVEPCTHRHAPEVTVPFLLMEAHHVDEPTRAVYQDIKSTLGLPFVNTDYRAFARWPSYFRLAWRELRKKVGTEAYESVVDSVHEEAVGLAASLPNPGGIRSVTLIESATRDASLDEVLAVARLFQWLLPGLVTNVAFLGAQVSVE